MSESSAADAIVISQQVLGKCVSLEQEIRNLKERSEDLEHRVSRLEGDLNE